MRLLMTAPTARSLLAKVCFDTGGSIYTSGDGCRVIVRSGTNGHSACSGQQPCERSVTRSDGCAIRFHSRLSLVPLFARPGAAARRRRTSRRRRRTRRARWAEAAPCRRIRAPAARRRLRIRDRIQAPSGSGGARAAAGSGAGGAGGGAGGSGGGNPGPTSSGRLRVDRESSGRSDPGQRDLGHRARATSGPSAVMASCIRRATAAGRRCTRTPTRSTRRSSAADGWIFVGGLAASAACASGGVVLALVRRRRELDEAGARQRRRPASPAVGTTCTPTARDIYASNDHFATTDDDAARLGDLERRVRRRRRASTRTAGCAARRSGAPATAGRRGRQSTRRFSGSQTRLHERAGARRRRRCSRWPTAAACRRASAPSSARSTAALPGGKRRGRRTIVVGVWPTSDTELFVGGTTLMRSRDGGATFTKVDATGRHADPGAVGRERERALRRRAGRHDPARPR